MKQIEAIIEQANDDTYSYYSGILSLSGMEKITGIHQKQLWNYLHTGTVPRKKQVAKIEHGLHLLGKELSSISL